MSPGSSSSRTRARSLRLVGELRRPLHAEPRDVRDLVERAVLAHALAELLGGAGLVEDVVDDLEQQPQLRGEGAVRLHVFRAAEQRTAHHGRLDQAAGLERVQGPQVVVDGGLPGDVHVLAADHALHAGRAGDLGERAEHRLAAAGLTREDQAERLREEAVAGQDGHVFSEGDVAGGPAAAQRVVVDRRQVVVDERVGVDELERGGGRQHGGRIGAAASRGRERQDRPDPLAAGEQRVAHRLGEPRGAVGRRRSRASPRYSSTMARRSAG